jgi:hypothetical protein
VVVVLRAHHQREIRDQKMGSTRKITPKDISQVNGGLIIGQINFKTLI